MSRNGSLASDVLERFVLGPNWCSGAVACEDRVFKLGLVSGYCFCVDLNSSLRPCNRRVIYTGRSLLRYQHMVCRPTFGRCSVPSSVHWLWTGSRQLRTLTNKFIFRKRDSDRSFRHPIHPSQQCRQSTPTHHRPLWKFADSVHIPSRKIISHLAKMGTILDNGENGWFCPLVRDHTSDCCVCVCVWQEWKCVRRRDSGVTEHCKSRNSNVDAVRKPTETTSPAAVSWNILNGPTPSKGNARPWRKEQLSEHQEIGRA